MATRPTVLLQKPLQLFEERTAAGDLAWAEQALALGFTPLTEVRPNVAWALMAAETDRDGARIAQRLVTDLAHQALDHPAQQNDLYRLLAGCLSTAIEHGNAPLLGAMEAVFDALPTAGQQAFAQHLMLGVHRLKTYRELLWGQLVNAAGQSSRSDKDPAAWAWVPSIPGYDPTIWTDPATGLRDTVAHRLYAAFTTATIFRTRRFLEQLDVEPFLGEEPDLIDAAMSPWRKMAPLDRWILTNDKRFTRTQELKALIEILDWAGRRGAPTSTLDGRDLLGEAAGWADQLAQRNDEVASYAGPLRQVVRRWETRALEKTVADIPDASVSRPRSRL